MSFTTVIMTACLMLGAGWGMAQGNWTVEVHTGTSWKPPTTLRIEQAGHEDVTIRDVRYETRPWSSFQSVALLTMNYYRVRVGYAWPTQPVDWGVLGVQDVAWGAELELLHDKAYYLSGDDPGGVVQHFDLSDGINYLLGNATATWATHLTGDDGEALGTAELTARAGVGPVITKPAATIRGQEYGADLQGTLNGYELAGVGAAVGVGARWFVTPHVFLALESTASYATTRQSIANGTASTNLPTLHVTFGVGMRP